MVRKGKTRCSEKGIRDVNSRAHCSFWSILCCHCFGTYTLSLEFNKLETGHGHLRIVLYLKTCPWKAKEIQRWGSTKAFWAAVGSASGFSRNSHWCYDSTMCRNQWRKGTERQLKCKEVCTTQSRFSYLPKSKSPMGCLATHVLLRKRGCKPWGYCNKHHLWWTGFVSLHFFQGLFSSLFNQLYEDREYDTTVPQPPAHNRYNKYML